MDCFDNSDIELLGVGHYSPHPASVDEPEDKGTTTIYQTTLGGEQEEEEVRTCVVNYICLGWTHTAYKHKHTDVIQ